MEKLIIILEQDKGIEVRSEIIRTGLGYQT